MRAADLFEQGVIPAEIACLDPRRQRGRQLAPTRQPNSHGCTPRCRPTHCEYLRANAGRVVVYALVPP
jgi:hypothetical protein